MIRRVMFSGPKWGGDSCPRSRKARCRGAAARPGRDSMLGSTEKLPASGAGGVMRWPMVVSRAGVAMCRHCGQPRVLRWL